MRKKRNFFVRLFRLIGWFYKCDFWIPGKISDRPRWSKIFVGNFFRSKKSYKSPKSWQLLNLYKELKHSLYKFYKGNASIPYINSKVTRFRIFLKVFWIFREFFHLEKNIPKFFWTPMSMQKNLRNPKIALRKSSNHSK